MSKRTRLAVQSGVVLTISLMTAALFSLFLINYENRIYFQILGDICGEIIENQPEAEQAVMAVLKEKSDKSAGKEEKKGKSVRKEKNNAARRAGDNILQAYGYRPADFMQGGREYSVSLAILLIAVITVLLLTLPLFGHHGSPHSVLSVMLQRKVQKQIHDLTDYLEKVNTGGEGVLVPVGEDDFAGLQDEIYKTVTELYQTRETALKEKSNFADNLYNIAHQMKTPLTSLSLSVQMMQDAPSAEHFKQLRRQIARLIYLEEALLLLSRIDAGILPLERKKVDIFTVLTLAADNLQELSDKANVSVHIPEAGEMTIHADMDWTMEALMNLFKNCMEHTLPGGTVYCSYEQNPLYTQIRIWDNGTGFAKEDIPHLFERFYRGQNAKDGGIGIGLALSKAIIERQNGTICAHNLAEGGACFEIHFYCH